MMINTESYNPTTNKFLTPEQAAELLQVSKRTVYEWIRNGEIPSERIGDRLIRIRESDVLSPDVRTYFEQGCKLSHQPETVELAAEFFNKAIKLNPRYMLAYFELGRMLYSWSHYCRAIEPLKKAIELNPSFPAYLNLGMNYNRYGMHREAEESLRKAIEIFPNHALAHFELGYSQMMISLIEHNEPKNAKESIANFSKALEIQPDYKQAADYIGSTLVLRLRDYDGASSFANKIEQTFPDVAEHIRLLINLNRR
jgi:excisionase family DNA binding protein